jgi:AcrR family transcriptional regulator
MQLSTQTAPEGDGRAARWAGQRARRRSEFVEAALRAIAELGPDASTEDIATAAGVARTQLYKHFDDATDLRSAIAARAAELLGADLRFWELRGSPAQMIRAAVDTHMGWLAEHRHLYQYLSRHSPTSSGIDRGSTVDVRTAIARHLTGLFAAYLEMLSLDPATAEPLAYGLVGLVDSATAHWLDHPGAVTQDELAARLARWTWLILDDNMRAGGVVVDPEAPMATPGER